MPNAALTCEMRQLLRDAVSFHYGSRPGEQCVGKLVHPYPLEARTAFTRNSVAPSPAAES